MGKHSVPRVASEPQSQAQPIVATQAQAEMPERKAHYVILEPHQSYAEYMNESLVGTVMREVTIVAPRRRFSLFSSSRAFVAGLVGITLGMGGAAMAATNTGGFQGIQTATVQSVDMSTADLDALNSVRIHVAVDGVDRQLVAKDTQTLGQVLDMAGITLGADDIVSTSLSQHVTNELAVTITRVTTQTVTETFEEPYTTREEETDDLDKGEKKVVTEGVNGVGTRTIAVTYHDGVEINREIVREAITQLPVEEVVQVGTRVMSSITGKPISGDKSALLAAAGIPESEWSQADWLIQKESGWNPNAVNPSSGACGLAQALPCSKMGPNWNDPVTALTWMKKYVDNRYGGFAGAVAHSRSTGWY